MVMSQLLICASSFPLIFPRLTDGRRKPPVGSRRPTNTHYVPGSQRTRPSSLARHGSSRARHVQRVAGELPSSRYHLRPRPSHRAPYPRASFFPPFPLPFSSAKLSFSADLRRHHLRHRPQKASHLRPRPRRLLRRLHQARLPERELPNRPSELSSSTCHAGGVVDA
jgi:hypothetical protein